LNQEREKKDKLSKSKFTDKALLSSASLLKGELELNGRRLVIMPSVAKTRVDSVIQENKDSAKGVGEDRRNLLMKKEGLLNEKFWIHQEPALTKKDLEQRQLLFTAKDSALKKSPNLSVSRVRMQIRNLPKRDFFETELRELLVKVIESYNKAHPKQKELRAKAAIRQVKILRDQEKTYSAESGEVLKLSSGLAFGEFAEAKIATYAVRYLNNLQLGANRGLVVDFALEDARKMHKRA